jgi:predicted lipid-binding transport protein (Tim44 family)
MTAAITLACAALGGLFASSFWRAPSTHANPPRPAPRSRRRAGAGAIYGVLAACLAVLLIGGIAEGASAIPTFLAGLTAPAVMLIVRAFKKKK